MRYLRRLALIAIIFLPLSLVHGGLYQQQSADLLVKAFSVSGANLQESSVHGWTRLPSGICTISTLENMVRQGISAGGEQPESYQFERNRTEKHNSVRAVKVTETHWKSIAAIAQDESASFMTVTTVGSTDQISQWEQQTSKILRSSGGIPQISSCLLGWINGKLNNGEWGDILSRSFALLDARRIDEMNDAKVSSITGYSPRLPGGLTIGGTQINVNMASRYSAIDNRTYITLGTPIIAREY